MMVSMLGILIILFTVLPALEFYLLFQVGSQIGAFNTFGIIIITGVVGAFLAKNQGLSILQKIQTDVGRGQMPGKHIVHGFIVFGGGLLLLTPGFITDILGFCMVIPGTRHIIVAMASNYLKRGIADGNMVFMSNIRTSNSGFSYYSSTHQDQSREPNPIDNNTIEAEYEERP